MKKLLLTLLASLLVTGSAWAEWLKVGESDAIYAYIDLATIRKDGNIVRVWAINDLKQRNKDGELSTRIRAEFDCKQERQKYLSLSTHSGRMASGTTIYTYDFARSPANWSEIPPGSIGETVLKIVCSQ